MMDKRFLLQLIGLWLGVMAPIGALGQLEYTDTVQAAPGVVVDELTPVLRVYKLSSAPLVLATAGPFELEITGGGAPSLSLEGHPGLLYQTSVSFREETLEVLLEPGLTGPLEKGRLKVRVGVSTLDKIRLRKGTVCILNLQQGNPLVFEIRDQVFFKGNLIAPRLQGVLSWKSEFRLSGAVDQQSWIIQGLSILRIPELKWREMEVSVADGSQIFTRFPGKVSGTLRSKSILEIPEGADLTQLTLREESRIQLPPQLP